MILLLFPSNKPQIAFLVFPGYIPDVPNQMKTRNKMKKNQVICLVSSSGGHLLKTYALSPWWKKYQRVWVTEDDPFTGSLLINEKKYFGSFPVQRSGLHFLINFCLAFWILLKEKPTHLFSTGAGIAPPFFLVGKILGCRTIFMETFIFIPKPTLSGRLCYYLSDYFLVQNQELLQFYPRAKYLGAVL